jgi:Flp pilus assembly protein TadG
MFQKFLADRRGNFAMMTSIAMVPLLGALALGVDYSEMSRQRQMTLNALDAAGIATARLIVEGATEDEARDYAREFFDANLRGIDSSDMDFQVVFPNSETGGGTLMMSATINYNPYFFPSFVEYSSGGAFQETLIFDAHNQVRLKNTLEVAMVLDNSGSMDFVGTGSGQKRMDLLKAAAIELVETIAAQGAELQQLEKPVQFSLVPFAGSVNVGAHNANATWMDTDGRSPIHHENFNWSSMPSSRAVTLSGGVYTKSGSGWGDQRHQKVTRFTLFDELRRVTGSQWVYSNNSWSQVPTYGSYTSWAGCVETRPHPYAYDNTAPSTSTPATLFVPMFAPDETDRRDGSNRSAMGNWWPDLTTSSNDATRQGHMPKYFEPAPSGTNAVGAYAGPNAMCSTKPITPLTDVTTEAGLATIKTAINAMQSLGATDVPEGVAWGWRTVSSAAPFSEGRRESERGNDKVVIILTDGENTYYTPSSLGYNDLATNRSIYSNKGYTARNAPGATTNRLFLNTTVSKTSYTNANYTSAMNQHMDTVCTAAKKAGVILMTVALDLSSTNSGEKAAIDALNRCASNSRFRVDPNDPTKPAKLFWNAKGGDLSETFRSIADELSNLRFVG